MTTGEFVLLKNRGPFATILADPAWPSKSNSGKRDAWLGKNMQPRYTTMTAAQIMAMPISELAAPDAMLVMWSTWMHLALAMDVISEWGFQYVTGMPWLKITKRSIADQEGVDPIFGPGVWFQHCTELILIARRGHPFGSDGNPRPARKGVIIAPRQKHSRKPDELQDWIDAKFPGPKLELFATQRRKDWVSWGDQLLSAG